MADEARLTIEYADHAPVTELIDIITYCVEGVSLEFDRWDDPYVQGPGLYFVIVAGTSIAGYADSMGDNRWPIDACRQVDADHDAFFEAAQTVAIEHDGAVVVTVDGTIHEQMVRLKDLSPEDLAELDDIQSVNYADWMGARHMSAVDTSARDEVVATITLSEEDGRVTVFQNGDYVDYQHESLGGVWRGDE
ncbi:MAG: DNA integrity scanning protein DisA nucleotide-binding domain protein [Haloplanus sp.]